MSKDVATPQQIKKLYAVVRNSGMEPKEYVEKLKKETGFDSLSQFTKRGMSKLIDDFENSESIEEKKTGVVEALEDRLIEIDAIFSVCLATASKTISIKFAGTEEVRSKMILDVAKLYFEEVQKGAERG